MAEVVIEMPGVTTTAVAERVAEAEYAHSSRPAPDTTFDLTDDDLERLTAPDGGKE